MSAATTSIFGQPAQGQPMAAPQANNVRIAGLLDRLKAKKTGERRMPAIIAIEGNKGVKTISAIAVPLKAGQSLKGTGIADTPGLPVPGGPVTVISFDHQTEASLQSYYGTTQAAVNQVEVIPIRQLLGFNAGQPRTAVDVVDGLRALLASWQSEKRAMIVMDRFDEFTENIVKLFCYSKANLPADAALVDRGVWNPRKAIIYEVIDLLIAATMDDGAVILTGSEEKDEGDEKVTVVNGKTVIAAVPSKWAKRVDMHLTARIGATVGVSDKTGEKLRFLTSHYSRYPAIPEGVRVPINGRHLGAFQDQSAHIQLEKDHVPQVVVAKK